MSELSPGINPVSEIDPKILDPDGLYIPRTPDEETEKQQDITRGSKDLYQARFKPPFSAVSNDKEEDVRPRADSKEDKGPISKHAAADRDHSKDGERDYTYIEDDYMNKDPKTDMLESLSVKQLEKLLEVEEERSSLIPSEELESEDIDDSDLLINISPQSTISSVDDTEYNSTEDDEVAVALDTFDHACQSPKPCEGPIEEILSEAELKLTESAGKGEISRFFQENPEVIHRDVRIAWNLYRTWAQEEGIEPAWIETFKRKHLLANINKEKTGAEPSLSKENITSSRGSSISSEELSGEFSDTLGHLTTASVEDLAPTLSVEEKFDQLSSKVYTWATNPMEAFEKDVAEKASGSKRHMMVCGSPGVGKTFSIKESVLRAIKDGITFKTQYVRGTIGKSVSNVMAFLYRFRQGYLVIFDDCDDFLDSDLGNVMKGVFELDSPSTNTGSARVRKMAMKNVTDLEEQPIEESNSLQKYLLKDLYEKIEDEEEDFSVDEDSEDTDLEEEEEKEEEILPARISFQSRILFISNKKRSRIDAAVRSRLSIVELYLTAEEIIGRIRHLLPQLLKNEKSVSSDKLQWAKFNALRWLELTVKANGRPIEFPDGRSLLLPFDTDRTVLEFRTYIDLVSGWLSQAKKYETAHKGEALMKMQKLPIEFLRGFLIGELIPILRDATSEGY